MQPALFSTSITLRPDLALTAVFSLIYIVTALYASAIPQGDRRWWPLAGLLALLVLAALQVESTLARMLLLDLAALTAVALVWTQPNPLARPAARRYLAMLAAGILCVGAGLYLAGAFRGPVAAAPAQPLARWIVALLIVGFALKLALLPFYFWLPGVAASSSAMTTVLIVATLDMAEFGELLTLRQALPWVFGQYSAIWLALALLSMLGGALLALAQHDLKRMLAFSTIDDTGYLLIGILAGPQALDGVLLGMLSHALFKTLLFGSVGIVEHAIGESLNLDCRGLSSRFPVSGAIFIFGSLGILGIPPLLGFFGRYRLYLAGYQFGGPLLLAAMLLATMLALLYYVRVIHRVWLGQAPGRTDGPKISEPRRAVAALASLAVVALALGFFPGLFFWKF